MVLGLGRSLCAALCAMDAVCHGCGVPWMRCAMDAVCHGCGVPWMRCAMDAVCHGCGVPWMRCAMDAACHDSSWASSMCCSPHMDGIAWPDTVARGAMATRTRRYLIPAATSASTQEHKPPAASPACRGPPDTHHLVSNPYLL